MSLAFLPFATGAAPAVGKEKPGLTVHLRIFRCSGTEPEILFGKWKEKIHHLPLSPLSASIEAAAVEAVVVVEAVVESIVVATIQSISN